MNRSLLSKLLAVGVISTCVLMSSGCTSQEEIEREKAEQEAQRQREREELARSAENLKQCETLFNQRRYKEAKPFCFKVFDPYNPRNLHPIASRNLGFIYFYGWGELGENNNPDTYWGLKYFEDASREGDGRASLQLGYIYLNGIFDVKPDWTKAYLMLKKASQSYDKTVSQEALTLLQRYFPNGPFIY